MDKEILSVDLGTKHKVFGVSKNIYLAITMLFKVISLGIAVFIGFYLCNHCLFCTTCNPVVVTYLALVSLACLANIGLPIDKLANVSLSK